MTRRPGLWALLTGKPYQDPASCARAKALEAYEDAVRRRDTRDIRTTWEALKQATCGDLRKAL